MEAKLGYPLSDLSARLGMALVRLHHSPLHLVLDAGCGVRREGLAVSTVTETLTRNRVVAMLRVLRVLRVLRA